MTNRAIVRLAQIAHEYDLAGMPREADIIESAMMRLADDSAVGKWWQGVENAGTGFIDGAKAVGNSLAAPFGGLAAGAKTAWDGGGLAYAPHAASEAVTQAWDRANADYGQEMQQYGKAVPALAGPGGTGLPGAAVEDAARGVGQAFQGAAQGYLNNAFDQREQAKEQANMVHWLGQAIQAHKANGTGWQKIESAIEYGGLSPDNQARLKQQFAQATAQQGSH